MGSIIITFLKKIFSIKRSNFGQVQENKDNKNYKEINEDNNFDIYDCIIPIKDIVLVDIKSSLQELLKAMMYDLNNLNADEQQPAEFALIYHEYTNDIVGIVYSKDLVFSISLSSKKDGCDFLFSPVIFTPMNMDITNAVELMNKKSSPALLVVDNKGIALGVSTKESFIDFFYNYEVVQQYFSLYCHNNQITVEGTLLLKHIPKEWYIKEFDICYASGTRTLGGFLSYHLGYIPKKNEEVIVNNFTFKVLEGNERFVKTILISKNTMTNS